MKLRGADEPETWGQPWELGESKRVGGGAAEIRSIRRLGAHPREGKSQEGNDLRFVLTDGADVYGLPGGLTP